MAKDEVRWRYGEKVPEEPEPAPAIPEPEPERPARPEEIRWTWGERDRKKG